MDINRQELEKMVSLTFDEDPRVRRDVAKKLAEIDDPAASFALIELTYDKDQGIKKLAKELISKYKKQDYELISFSELFGAGREVRKPEPGVQEETPGDKKERMLAPIEKVFEKKLGKEKAKLIRQKMMPSIEKIYLKNTAGQAPTDKSKKEAMQEFITSYFDVISDIERIGPIEGMEEHGKVVVEDRIDVDGMRPLPKEFKATQKHEAETMEGTAEGLMEIDFNEPGLPKIRAQGGDTSFFMRAYETMMLSEGDEKVMKNEMKRLQRQAEDDIKLAFQLARDKFKEERITDLTKIKDGMRNINTELLVVAHVENVPFKHGKEKIMVTRVVVKDGDGNEGVVYLSDNRGLWLKPEMRVKVIDGYAKVVDDSTAILLSPKKGSVHVVL